MSDIRIYTEANMPTSPLTGDVVICSDAFNLAPANSVHLCTNATGPLWKSFANDGAAAPFLNEYSVSFNGSSDYLLVEQNSSINISGSITLSAWVKLDSLGSYQGIITKRSGSATNYQFFVRDTNVLSFYNGSSVINDTVALTTGGWIHVAVTVNNSSVNFYHNGSLTSTGSGLSLSSNTVDLTMGEITGSSFLSGKLDECSVFDRSLSDIEVASLIDSSGANPVPADISSFINNGLSAWWRMGEDSNDTFVDGGSVASITDSSGNGNTATQATASAQPTFSTSVPS